MKNFSKISFLLMGIVLGLGLTISAAVVITTPEVNPGEVVKSIDWNKIKNDLNNLAFRSWDRAENALYYMLGSVGIKTSLISKDLSLDVEGKVGATHCCDENGENCITVADLKGLYERINTLESGGSTGGSTSSASSTGSVGNCTITGVTECSNHKPTYSPNNTCPNGKLMNGTYRFPARNGGILGIQCCTPTIECTGGTTASSPQLYQCPTAGGGAGSNCVGQVSTQSKCKVMSTYIDSAGTFIWKNCTPI